MKLWDEWEAEWNEIHDIAETLILANCYDPKFAMPPYFLSTESDRRYQV